MKRRIVELLSWADFRFDGIRARLLIAAAVLQVLLAPMWDRYEHAGKVAANMEPLTFLATLLFLTLLVLIGGGRLVTLTARDDGETQGAQLHDLVALVRRLLWRAQAAWRRDRRWLDLAAQVLAGAFVALLALKGVVGMVRWAAWKSINLAEGVVPSSALWEPLRSALEWVFYKERSMRTAALYLSFGAAACAVPWVLRRPRLDGGAAGLRDPGALAGFDPLLERQDLRDHERVSALFNGDVVRGLLQALAQWTPDRTIYDENSCRDHILLFLRERGYRVSAERWLHEPGRERRRVDLLVDECVPVELKYEIHEKSMGERDRVRSQVESYAQLWRHGPVLLFLVRTPRAGADRYREPVQLWNGRLDGSRSPIMVLADS